MKKKVIMLLLIPLIYANSQLAYASCPKVGIENLVTLSTFDVTTDTDHRNDLLEAQTAHLSYQSGSTIQINVKFESDVEQSKVYSRSDSDTQCKLTCKGQAFPDTYVKCKWS